MMVSLEKTIMEKANNQSKIKLSGIIALQDLKTNRYFCYYTFN